MIFECFACGQPQGLIPKIIHKEGESNKGVCRGICHRCGVVVCTGHGRRNENPYEFQCTYCTGDFIERGGFLPPDDPSDPTSPDDLQRLVDAVSDLKVEIVEHVRQSVRRYLKDNDMPSSARFNNDVLEIAAKAYREVAGVPAKRQQPVPAPA
jgi:hypothetical protein